MAVSAAAASSSPSSSTSSPYVILCDAGSTGTRLYVYNTDPNASAQQQQEQSDGGGESGKKKKKKKKKKGHDDQSTTTADHHHGHDVVIQEGPKMRPGLSSQQPNTVTNYLQPALTEALTMIPTQYHATTPVYVYATAGMRLLPSQFQLDIYDALSDGLVSDMNVPFQIDRSNFKTIGGEDEGYYAALAVNYLGGRIGSDLTTMPSPPGAGADAAKKGKGGGGDRNLGGKKGSSSFEGAQNLLGALDLGGASAQIVFDANMSSKHRRSLDDALHPQDNQRAQGESESGGATRKLKSLRGAFGQKRKVGDPISRRDFFSLSLLGYGGDRMRESVEIYVSRDVGVRVDHHSSGGNDRVLKKDKNKDGHKHVENPCYPPGYETTISPSGLVHVGTGRGTQCTKVLDAVMEEITRGECVPGQFCKDLLGGIVPPVQEKFYAFTLFAYALGFARDVLDKLEKGDKKKQSLTKEEKAVQQSLSVENPTLRSMRDATDLICSWEYSYLAEQLPGDDKVPHRCMEFSLSVTLLTKFGFPDKGNNVHFTDKIDGRDAEWTLGAYLHLVNGGDNADGTGQSGSGGTSSGLALFGGEGRSFSSGGVIPDMAALFFVCTVCALVLGFCVRYLLRRSPVSGSGSSFKSNGGGGVGVKGNGSGVGVKVKPPGPPTRTLSFPM